MTIAAIETAPDREQAVWRSLSNPVRRRILDLLSDHPLTTGDLSDAVADLSRFAVMQHLGVLVESGLVTVRRRGRHRYNHLNPVPLREWYERWVSPMAETAAAEVLALRRHVEEGDEMTADQIRTVRIATELRFKAAPQKVFDALTRDTLKWFPHTYGEGRTKAVVAEPKVGGRVYEDWGDGTGYLYGTVTEYDPPGRFATRGRLFLGVILDSEYTITADGDETILANTKVAMGPMTEEEASSVQRFGDLVNSESALRAHLEG